MRCKCRMIVHDCAAWNLELVTVFGVKYRKYPETLTKSLSLAAGALLLEVMIHVFSQAASKRFSYAAKMRGSRARFIEGQLGTGFAACNRVGDPVTLSPRPTNSL